MYDLIKINNYDIPDVKKGDLVITPNPKYNEYENEVGGKVIDIISEGRLMGSVNFTGLLESEIQGIMSHISLVSNMTIYNPFTNATRSFKALILVGESAKIIHDSGLNAWSWGFTFEEIGDITS